MPREIGPENCGLHRCSGCSTSDQASSWLVFGRNPRHCSYDTTAVIIGVTPTVAELQLLSLIGGKPRWCHSLVQGICSLLNYVLGLIPPGQPIVVTALNHSYILFVTILSRHLVLVYTLYFCNLRIVILTRPPYVSGFDSFRDLSCGGYTTS